MAKRTTKQNDKPVTTAQKLGSVVKSARDIMRTDKGLNGELDRLPQLTWIMFLKLLDDAEKLREVEAELEGKLDKYKPMIQPPYRWRDWAANNNFTGDRLKNFINNDEASLPDDTRGAGLLAYLRNLKSKTGGERADVIAKVFKDVTNRMISGTLLWDVINKVNEIHFDKSEEVNILSTLYESMLKEMRDAAGDSGEFYTPRPVVRLMVQVMEPKLGEKIFDPACGTGGFLVEAYEYLKKQCTSQDWQTLQKSIIGAEAKSLPLMLAHMSLVLHGFEYPDIDDGNSLRFTLSEMGEKHWVDVIFTNPPFGGEEEDRIKNNFPPERQTKEAALLFLQLIMRRLRQHPKAGRAAVVFPNGVLFGDGVCAKIKEDLLKNFNLHTIVRLPKGVFAPYTDIPTNLLFFDASGQTEEIWYYEIPLPEGRKAYTKTKPIQDEEFTNCLAWWNNREKNEHAWKYEFREAYNQARKDATVHWEAAKKAEETANQYAKTIQELAKKINAESKFNELPEYLVPLMRGTANVSLKEQDIAKVEIPLPPLEDQQRIVARVEELAAKIEEARSLRNKIIKDLNGVVLSAYHKLIQGAEYLPMKLVAPLQRRPVEIELSKNYPELGIRSFGKGTFHKPALSGAEVGTKKIFRIAPNDLMFQIVFAWEGAVAVAQPEDHGRFGSHRFLTCVPKPRVATSSFLCFHFLTEQGLEDLGKASPGGAGRNRTLGLKALENIKVPVPHFEKQLWFDNLQAKVDTTKRLREEAIKELDALLPSILDKAFKGEL